MTRLQPPDHLGLGRHRCPIAIGLALGVAVVTGGVVLFGSFNFPPAANVDLAILFPLTLIAVLLAG